jgi:hypothetical protein
MKADRTGLALLSKFFLIDTELKRWRLMYFNKEFGACLYAAFGLHVPVIVELCVSSLIPKFSTEFEVGIYTS